MVKRLRVDSDSEDDYQDDEASDQGTSSKPASKKSRKTAPTKARKGGKANSKQQDVVPSERVSVPHSTDSHLIQSPTSLVDALITWYTGVSTLRGMPWRKKWDPNLKEQERAQRAYEVWVSEIMLQQTQVATVISYYNAWMTKFPTLPDLAASTIDEVNSSWKGLGYYSRASRLLAGAQKAVESFHGKLPSTAAKLQAEIPGIGRYSAGAIASIAYGERVPVLDGNVHRLMSRVLGLYANPKSKSTLDVLWNAATAVVAKGDNGSEEHHPGDVNQALIELGSTVCKVRDPGCKACPLNTYCSAFIRANSTTTSLVAIDDIEDLCTICEPLPEDSSVTIYPLKAVKKKAREELDIVNVVEWRSSEHSTERQILLVKRPSKGLLAGLSEFPTATDVDEGIAEAKMKQIPKEILADLITYRQASIKHVKQVGDVLHLFSHIRKTYRAQHVLLVSDSVPALTSTAETAGCRWLHPDEVSTANIGTGIVKVWKLVQSANL